MLNITFIISVFLPLSKYRQFQFLTIYLINSVFPLLPYSSYIQCIFLLLFSNSRGNTVNPVARYIIVLNNYNEEEYNEIVEHCVKCAKFYIIAREIGGEGTPHLQMYIEWNKKIRYTTLKKYKGFERCHFEQAKGSKSDNINYCKKDNDFICSDKNIMPTVDIITLKCNELYPWQFNINLTGIN